jgi:putative ABC transport system permease protein
MIAHLLKNAWRRLLSGRMYSIINVLGLAVGMAGFVLIALWINNQYSYDKFHSNYTRIAKVMQHQIFNDGNLHTFDSSPVLLAAELKQDFPEVEETVRVILDFQSLIGNEKEAFFETGGYADAELFSVFSFRIKAGAQVPKIFPDDNSIVISNKLAEKLFAGENPVGRTLSFNKKEEHKVTAVFEDVPENSNLKFEYILPFSAFIKLQPQTAQWSYNVAKTFVLLKDRNSLEILSDKIKPVAKKHNEDSHTDFFLYPLSKIYLFGKFKDGVNIGGRIDNLVQVGGIAVLILAMACINFINLTTAISSTRAKEVGVRKVVGAEHQQLIGQFIGETLVISLVSLIISLGLVYLVLPLFNELFSLNLAIDYTDPTVLMIVILTTVFTGLLAGAYPAFVLSSFQPSKVLKSSSQPALRAWFRKSLIVVQLVLSMSLIVSTIIMYEQIQFIKSKELGFNKENIIRFRARGDVLDNFESFKTEALGNPAIIQMTSTDSAPIGRKSSTTGFSWPGKVEGNDVLLETSYVNYDFVETLEMTLKLGRSFSRDFPSDSMAVMLNEAAVDQMGLRDPIGAKLNSGSYFFEVIGVIKNHHATSMQNDFLPFVFLLSNSNANIVMARIAAGKSEEAVESLKNLYKKFEPVYPFEFTFLDETFMKLYQNETRLSMLATWFAGLAIFISCLGLLGLSAYSANRRRKEIAVRKVMGAKTSRIIMMLNIEYIKLIVLSVLLAVPISYYASSTILDGYSFRPEVNELMILLFSGVFLSIVCVLTVSYYSLRAANANPVETLKYE